MLIVTEPKKRKPRAKRDVVSTTYRFTRDVKDAVAESAEKNNRSENQQAEFLIKVGYLHTFGIDLNNISDRDVIDQFDKLMSERVEEIDD